MQMRRKDIVSLAVRSFAHFLVDAVCASALYGRGCGTAEILVYDTIAFSTQCMTGMIADRFRSRLNAISACSCLLLAMAFVTPAGNMTRAAVLGIGNSFFHTSAGATVLAESRKKAYPEGVFVAPGCIGLALGTLFPGIGRIWAAGAVLIAAALSALGGEEPAAPDVTAPNAAPAGRRAGHAVPLSLFTAVAVRAFGGSVVSFSWKNGAVGALLVTVAVFAGKAAGGFAADRLDVRKLSLFSVTAAAFLIAFGNSDPALSLAGQFLINLTMPVTLWLMYLALPDEPGFAFGLSAAALWPGSLAGYLVSLTGAWRWICVLISFLSGAAAILYSIRIVEKGGSFDE